MRVRAANRGSRKALLGSVFFHAALLAILFRVAAARPDPAGLHEMRTRVAESTPLADPTPPPPPEPTACEDAPPPEVFDEPPPEEAVEA